MKHRLALVTGATSGIGEALCFLFAQKGLSLLITGRDRHRLDALVQQLSPQIVLQAIEADLSTSNGRQKVMALIHEYGPDLVINNAGFGLYGEALTYPTEEQEMMIEVNVTAVTELTLEAARTLISDGKEGIVFNVSSAAAFQVIPNMAIYAASKAFVNQFSQGLDDEVKKYGVRILTICPGMVKTSFSKRAGQTQREKKVGVMSADFVAREIWKQVQNLKPLTIIDWKYRFLTRLSAWLSSWTTAIIKKNIAERIAPRNLIKRESCIKKNLKKNR